MAIPKGFGMETPRRVSRGLTLIEVTLFVALVSIALLGTLSLYSRQILGGRLTEQRRRAMIMAEEKMDEIRAFIADAPAKTALAQVWTTYGPTPANTGLARACCQFSSINNPTAADLPASPGRPLISVTLINSEQPTESQFGLAYDGSTTPAVFGVDINGNRRYSDAIPNPFPLDLNGDGDTTDNNVTSGFYLLPVVITVQWTGPQGSRERIDVFNILMSNKNPT